MTTPNPTPSKPPATDSSVLPPLKVQRLSKAAPPAAPTPTPASPKANTLLDTGAVPQKPVQLSLDWDGDAEAVIGGLESWIQDLAATPDRQALPDKPAASDLVAAFSKRVSGRTENHGQIG